jgi:N-acetylglucosaminyldiphosphoundecaprenol N-acetyl-beta-D-mannosaminyltransferase
MEQTVQQIEEFLTSNRFNLIVTADSSMIVDAQEDNDLANIIKNASLVTPDSAGVLWAAKKSGVNIPQKVSGVEIVLEACKLSAKNGARIAFLGAEPGVAELAAEKLRELAPGCNIVGTHHGYFKPNEDEKVAEELTKFQPDILFVAMGIPRQEKFLSQYGERIGAKVGAGVGGSLDVYSGRAKRAPKIFQQLKLEWFWRLILNPSKWQKTMKLPIFMKMVLRSRR